MFLNQVNLAYVAIQAYVVIPVYLGLNFFPFILANVMYGINLTSSNGHPTNVTREMTVLWMT